MPSNAEQSEATTESDRPTLLSPEGAIMLLIAAFLDALGAITLILSFFIVIPIIGTPLGVFGMILSFGIDIIGIITIGAWAFLRFRKIPRKHPGKKLIISAISEAIPGWGDIAPSWTIMVWNLLS